MQCITAAIFPIRNWRANWTVLRLFLTETTYGTQTQRPGGHFPWWSQTSCLEYDEYIWICSSVIRFAGRLFIVAWLCLDSDKCYHSLISIHSTTKALRLGAGMVKLSLRSFEKVEAIEDEAHALRFLAHQECFWWVVFLCLFFIGWRRLKIIIINDRMIGCHLYISNL